jgi:hypothetical protein
MYDTIVKTVMQKTLLLHKRLPKTSTDTHFSASELLYIGRTTKCRTTECRTTTECQTF